MHIFLVFFAIVFIMNKYINLQKKDCVMGKVECRFASYCEKQ